MTHALLLSLLTAGRISGTVAYAGTAPRVAKIAKTDAWCKAELVDPTVTLSPNGKAVANVVVRVTAGATASEPPSTSVVVTQHDCMYEPRVQGAIKGQRIVVKNADGTMHNVHAYAGLDDKKTLFNVAQPPGAKDVERDPKGTVGIVRFKCDVHPWMRAYVIISEHPFFSVTDADGRFEIGELPAGKYTVEAWHEKLGTLTAELVVEDGKAATPAFSFR